MRVRPSRRKNEQNTIPLRPQKTSTGPAFHIRAWMNWSSCALAMRKREQFCCLIAQLASLDYPRSATAWISEATPEFLAHLRTTPCPAPYHRPVARRTTRGNIARHIHRDLLLILVISSLITPLDPVEQLSQQEYSDAAKNNGSDRFPDQGVHELVKRRVRHAKDSSNFAAQSPTVISDFARLPRRKPLARRSLGKGGSAKAGRSVTGGKCCASRCPPPRSGDVFCVRRWMASSRRPYSICHSPFAGRAGPSRPSFSKGGPAAPKSLSPAR